MYTVGEKVVHPMHGAGVIEEITEERMEGTLKRYYVFSAPPKQPLKISLNAQ